MLKGKAGFVIPKNKFSGSLVPVFKGGKKSASDDAADEESSKQVQRKTKWGPDLTQDASVKKGRALAYQTRLDQIAQQLKLGSTNGEAQDLKSAGDVPDNKPSTLKLDDLKLQSLDLERREAIGEILKLNPSYKVPSDYQPVMREAIVQIPVKEHPDFNFVPLLYGADGETHKRLEKETGTVIRVYGTKIVTGETVEVTASDGIALLNSCNEVHVWISAETYDKVDAAASLVEMLFSSVPGKSVEPDVSASVAGDKLQSPADTLNMSALVTQNFPGQELQQAVAGSRPTSSQPYPGSWFPIGQPNMPFGFAPVPNSMASSFNPSPANPAFMHRPAPQYGIGSPHGVGPPRLNQPAQAMQNPYGLPAYPLGQSGPPRTPMSPSLLVGHQLTGAGSPRVVAQPAERPLIAANSPRWVVPAPGGPQSLSSSPVPPSAPSINPRPFLSTQVGPAPATHNMPPPMRSTVPMPVHSFSLQAPVPNPSPNNLMRPAQLPMPHLSGSHPPQSGVPRPGMGPPNSPSFTPLKPLGGVTPRPTVSSSSDFSFHQRLQGPSQSLPGPGVSFASQRPPPGQLPPPQSSAYRPNMQNTIQQPVGQNYPGAQHNQMGPRTGQFGPSSPHNFMGPRNLGPSLQMANAAGPFTSRVGQSGQFQQRFPGPPMGRPGGSMVGNQHPGSSGRSQAYDPFSPTPVSGNNAARNQESDPEYEDLMASVGVK